MKKKRIVTLCCIMILITGITALCSENAQKLFFEDYTDVTEFETEIDFDFGFEFEPLIPEEIMTEIQVELEEVVQEVFSMESVENTFADVCMMIEENDFELVDEMHLKNDFIATAVNYSMSPTELRYVKNLFEEGYDMEKVLAVYEFIRWTDCDIESIAGIYDAGIENCDEENWIYEAYDKFFDRTDDILSVEDVAYYVENGITVEEIVGVYELSFAGAKSTKQMLSERLSGESWNEITASSLSKTPEVVINAPEMTMAEIMGFRNISVRQRKDFAEITDVQGDRVELNEEARSAESSRILEKDRLMVEYDVAPIADEASERRTVKYANGKTQVFSVDEEHEEYLIPIEEPEVE